MKLLEFKGIKKAEYIFDFFGFECRMKFNYNLLVEVNQQLYLHILLNQ